jgi:hypothetical protein
VPGLRRRLLRRWRESRSLRLAGISILALAVVGVLVAAGMVRFPRIEALFETSGGDGSILVESPASGALLRPGDTVEGTATGPGVVYVWVQGVNFALPVPTEAGAWRYEYAGGLTGERTLAFALVHDGHWGTATTVRYAFDAPEPGPPTGFRRLFAPFLDAVESAVTVLTGRGSGDLDQNGVSDQWQGSLGAPTGGALARIPYVNASTLTLGAFGLALVGAYAWRTKEIHAFLLRRAEQRRRAKADRLSARRERERLRLEERSRLVDAKRRVAEKRLGVVERLHRLRFRTVLQLRRHGPKGGA